MPPRFRQTKIVATMGPASTDKETIRSLALAGVDMFRLNFSHGTADDHRARMKIIREVEAELGRPFAVLGDLQGPKLRLGTFVNSSIAITVGQKIRLDLDPTPGDDTRVQLPHPEIFAVIKKDSILLVDDGKVRLRVLESDKEHALVVVEAGQKMSDRKGVNMPDVILPISILTKKDLADLETAIDMGVDWLAISFVQCPADVVEAHKHIKGRIPVLVKLEKPTAVTPEALTAIIDMVDCVMVARGDLGVEVPAEEVPSIQRRIIRAARVAGKPVIVATQMLESMISSPTPTRAEVSDVATAVYEGADAVMLSAETAAGQYPLEAVTIMDKVIRRTQADPDYRGGLDEACPAPKSVASDAITAAARQVAETIHAAAIVTYTTSGSTTLRAVRERPDMPILCLTSDLKAARRLSLSFGVHAVHTADISDFSEMVEKAVSIAKADCLAKDGQSLVITAGVPFGKSGTTNVLRIATVGEKA